MIEVGNIVDWDNAKWRAIGLEEEVIEKKEVCMAGKQPQLVVSEKRRNFDDTQAFCEVLGGETAVVIDNATAEENIEASKSQDEFDKCSEYFSLAI